MNNNMARVKHSVEAGSLVEKWGRPVTDITLESVQEIVDDAKRDGLFDNVLQFDEAKDALEHIQVTVEDFGEKYRIGANTFGTSKIRINTECPHDKVRSAVLHEMIHPVCYRLEAVYHTNDKVQSEQESFFASLQNKLEICVPNFTAMKDVETLWNWVYQHEDKESCDMVFRDFVPCHGNAFWLLSVNIDYILGWPIGLTAGYDLARIVQSIAENGAA